MRWSSLRPIQETAIKKVLQGDADLIISANTASGKTEAAFLPILSQIFNAPKPSVQAVYVGPLKALINDQFRRLENLCERANIPVHRWHGDVDSGRKKRLTQHPGGVLLITPESIESLLLNRTSRIATVFRNLESVVIDEIHSLVGIERGTHLRSLLFRLRQQTEHDFRLIGLSATLGDAFPTYRDWMRPDGDREVDLIEGSSESKRLLYKIHGFLGAPPKPRGEATDDDTPPLPVGLSESMFQHFVGKKNLIFANSKSDVEQYADALNTHCRSDGRPEEFLVHHGSLSKESREFTEREMLGRRPRTTVCSSTLELGIDIGNVAAVGQVSPPWSVSSLVQRLGRSGRGEDEPQCMRLYITEQPITEKSSLLDKLHLDLLRAAAATELMLERPTWVEPPFVARFDLSTFTHQILSSLAQSGGAQASQVFESLTIKGAFRNFSAGQFSRVLRCLAAKELIEQTPQGDLILAPKGEQMVRHYSFYSAFASGSDYSVLHRSVPIGMLPADSLPKIDDHFLLGGRRWQVMNIDDSQREVIVKKAQGKKPPKFFGGGGEIHPRVREKMKQIVCSNQSLPYLDDAAAILFTQAQETANASRICEANVVALSPNRCLWFTWTGTRIQRTLCLLADHLGLACTDRDVAIEFESTGKDELVKRLPSIAATTIDAIQLAQRLPSKHFRKLDELLSDDLLCESLGCDFLDVDGAVDCIEKQI
ncbi:DEAD/DEAH box helicase [Novipirellula sp.]|uniref:DEAD/DEAH box helicase n=1 Tax=Novipirellula sp. TaxID=2795430 RepID=UPI0035697F66